MANWTADLETTIYSAVLMKTYSELVEDYPNINYTTEESTTTPAKFPNVYIHVLDSPENGSTTEGGSLNALYLSVQVDVTTNEEKSDARKVIYAVLDVLKDMCFQITTSPIFTKEDDVHRAVMRARRMIGDGDMGNLL